MWTGGWWVAGVCDWEGGREGASWGQHTLTLQSQPHHPAVPGDNSVDLLTNDLGLVVITNDKGELEGFDVFVGGGMGRCGAAHGQAGAGAGGSCACPLFAL